jgi:hypothetical protein
MSVEKVFFNEQGPVPENIILFDVFPHSQISFSTPLRRQVDKHHSIYVQGKARELEFLYDIMSSELINRESTDQRGKWTGIVPNEENGDLMKLFFSPSAPIVLQLMVFRLRHDLVHHCDLKLGLSAQVIAWWKQFEVANLAVDFSKHPNGSIQIPALITRPAFRA